MSARHKQMPRRMAQVLAALVFLANRSGGKIPSTKQLWRRIGKREKDAAAWMNGFYSTNLYIDIDEDEPANDRICQYLAATAAEATAVLAVYRELQKSGYKTTQPPLMLGLMNQDQMEQADIMNVLRAKGYIKGTYSMGYSLTEKAMWHLPYLRILAKNA